MEQKNIFIEPNEEIVSVIDRLIQSKDREVNLVIPRGAQIWQSSINLKLLKREADILNKDVTLVVVEDMEKETAESAGFRVRKERDLPVKFAQTISLEEKHEIIPMVRKKESKAVQIQTAVSVKPVKKELGEDKENMIGLLVEEMESEQEKEKVRSSFENAPAEEEVAAELAKKETHSELDRFAPSSQSNKKMMDIVDPEKVKVNFFRKKILNEFPLGRKKGIEEEIESESRPEPNENISPRIESAGLMTKKNSFAWSKFLAFFIILSLVISGTVAYLVLPSTEIIITPKAEKKNFDLSLIGTIAISRVDEVLNRLPLQEIKVIKSNSQEFVATGEKQLNQKAKGIITVYNEYSSSPQTLVGTTRFESSDGKVFRIPKTITVPGAKIEEGKIIPESIDIEVIADQPGSNFNIGPTDFTIPGFKGSPKFASFYGKSKNSMSGGSTEKVKIVLAEDLEQAEKILVDGLKGEVNHSLEEQIPSDLKILKEGLKEEVADVNSTAKENDPVEKFTVSVDVVVRALLYKEKDLKDLIDLNLIAQILDDKRPLSNTQKVEWKESNINWSKGEANLSLEIEEDLALKINTDKLKTELIGKKEVDVRKYLASQPEIEKAKVSFWPFWVNKIPKQEKKIKIIVE